MFFKKLFCNHNWESVEKEVEVYNWVEQLTKAGVVRFSTCSKCHKHKEIWLYYTYKRKG
jgi:hypothetical protein